MRIILLTPARRFIANRFGVGYQIPLGLVFIGGPLLDAGHIVKLIDNDLYGWSHAKLIEEIRDFAPDCIMLGHTGSTAAHSTCLDTASALRSAFPHAYIVYGGVYPTYAAEETLKNNPAIDVIVRGEAEQTVLDLATAWQTGTSLAEVLGIAWRAASGVAHAIQLNRPQPTLRNLDAYRPGWELVDWQGYQLFGMGRAAGMQFSRGCSLTCTYCGQWMFWRKWRHRSSQNVVAQLRLLAEQYDVKIVWFADEFFNADREAARDLLQHLAAAKLGLSLNINMTAASVVRDADLLPLYKAAGVDYVVMGVESLEDEVVTTVRKDNPFAISKQAVQLLRDHHIISLTNLIYGLEDETTATLQSKFAKLLELDSDILNAVYLTPHFWTADGRATDPASIMQPDQAKWTYRNQVIATPNLSPSQLFCGVKLTEALYHLRPNGLKRLFRGGDTRIRHIMRASMAVGGRVMLAETAEFVADRVRAWLAGPRPAPASPPTALV